MSKPLPCTPPESSKPMESSNPPDPSESPAMSEVANSDADINVYSTLEVHQGRFIEVDSSSAPIVRPQPDSMKIATFDKNAEKEIIVTEVPIADASDLAGPLPERKILSLKRKTFFLVLTTLVVCVFAAAVGGGVGGAKIRAKEGKPTQVSMPTNTTHTPTATAVAQAYTNTGLAAMQWTDQSGVLHKRLYYQDNENKIRESAWDNNTAFSSAWVVQAISDAVKPETPIGAVAGYPHASYNYTLVKNVYYMSPDDELTERQAKANDSQSWEDDNFTGLYSGSNSTFLSAYWCQNIWNVSQELVVLFQQDNFDNGITQARYTSANDSSNPWVANNFPFAQPQGANFAMSLVSYRSGKHLMLYTIGDNNKVGQYQYTINDNVDSTSLVSLTSQSATPLTVDPRAPLAVVAQDNQPLYTTETLPECYQQTPLTNLIFFATPDRKSLMMSAWNCTDGFADHTAEIEPLQKSNTTYLSLAAMSDRATGDGNVYIMFDSGQGPEVEEWTVPQRAGEAWTTSRKVNVDFAL